MCRSSLRTKFLAVIACLLAVLWLAEQYGVSWDQSIYYLKLTLLFVASIILTSALIFALFRVLKKWRETSTVQDKSYLFSKCQTFRVTHAVRFFAKCPRAKPCPWSYLLGLIRTFDNRCCRPYCRPVRDNESLVWFCFQNCVGSILVWCWKLLYCGFFQKWSP